MTTQSSDSVQQPVPDAPNQKESESTPAATTRPIESPASHSSIPVTDAQLHYQSVLDFLKYKISITMGAITLLIAVGLYFSYRDMAAMRTEVRGNLAEVKSEIRQNLVDAKSDTRSLVDTTREQTRDAIKAANEATDVELKQIRDRSATIALSEAQRRVDDAFHNRNIEGMVESAASRQVAPVIERQLKTEVDRAMGGLRQDISFLGQISDAGAYLRVGGRKGLDKLVALLHSAPNENMRLAARSMLETIGRNYEEFATPPTIDGKERDFVSGYLSDHKDELKDFSESEKRARLIPILIREIRTSDDLFSVTTAFVALRKLTNHNFHVFDMDALNTWCAEHASQCK